MDTATFIFYLVTYAAFWFLVGIASTVIFGKRGSIGELVVVDTDDGEQYMFLRIEKERREKLRDPFVKLEVIHKKYESQDSHGL